MTAILVDGLRKSYGAVEAVRGVSFHVDEGEVFGLLGPNGAGKTTIIEILEGYRKRDAGDVTVLGIDPRMGGRKLRERVGLVLQEAAVPPMLSVTEQGYGKRTELEEYRVQSRGGIGIINIQTSDRNGKVVGIAQVSDDDELMLITQQGKFASLKKRS